MSSLEQAKKALFDLDVKTALDCAKHAVEENKEEEEGYRILSYIYSHLYGDNEQGLVCLEQGIKACSKDYRLFAAKGDLCLLDKQYKVAKRSYLLALELSPEGTPEILTGLGHCHLALLEILPGKEALLKALQLNPLFAEALRTLQRVYVREGDYSAAFELWKLDCGIKNHGVPVGTRGRDCGLIQDALARLGEKPKVCELLSLAKAYYQVALFEDALVVYERVLAMEKENQEAKAQGSTIRAYQGMLLEYQAASRALYQAIAKGKKKEPKRHWQKSYELLLTLATFFPELAELGPRRTKGTWKKLEAFYLREFRLVVRSYFTLPAIYGSYLGYMVNEQYHLLNQGYNQGQYILREVARDLSHTYSTWVWSYFKRALGGWVEQKGPKIIYRCTDRYRQGTEYWKHALDETRVGHLEGLVFEELEKNEQDPLAVFYFEPLAKLFQARYAHAVYEEAKRYNAKEQQRKYFFQRLYDLDLQTSLTVHEGKYAIIDTGFLTICRFQVYGLLRGMRHYETAVRYRSKLNALCYAEIPFSPLAGLINRGIHDPDPDSQSCTLILQRFSRYIKRNAVLYPRIDTKRNIMLQLWKLSCMEIKQIADGIA